MATILELPTQANFLLENSCSFSVFDRQATINRSSIQRATAIALRPLMLCLADGKSTHWFDYRLLPDAQKYEGLRLAAGNSFDVYHPNRVIRQFRFVQMSLGGWKDAALIGPDPERADLDRLSKTGWLYGYRIPGANNQVLDSKYSGIVNPGFSSMMALRGPYPLMPSV